MKFNKSIFGMIHLAGGMNCIERALDEIKIFEDEGVQGVIVENYHGSTDEVIEVLKNVKSKMDIGINILPNEYEIAFELADRFNSQFIQLDFISGVYELYGKKTRQLDEERYLSYREKYPDIKVLGGVWPKYYKPISGSNLESDLKNAMKLCDAVVVTGAGTGKETPINKIIDFGDILGNFPLIIGAGLSISNIEQMQFADGAIVGSSFKYGGVTTSKVNNELVKDFMTKLRTL